MGLVLFVLIVILGWGMTALAIIYPIQTMVGIAAIAWITMIVVWKKREKGN